MTDPAPVFRFKRVIFCLAKLVLLKPVAVLQSKFESSTGTSENKRKNLHSVDKTTNKSGPKLLSPLKLYTSVVVAFSFHGLVNWKVLQAGLLSTQFLTTTGTTNVQELTHSCLNWQRYSPGFFWSVLQNFGWKIPHTRRSNSETWLAFCWVRLETCWLSVFWVGRRNGTNGGKEHVQANQQLGFPDSQSWNIVENESSDGTSGGVLEGLPSFLGSES